jgi:hypothetical protein
MSNNDEDLERKNESEDDVEGHSLLLDTDYYIQRKGRDAEAEREARERRQAKEARTNKPEQR